MSTLFVQLTDLHIREPGRLAYGRLDTAPYLRRAVQTIEQLRQKPQAVVLTGDLTDFGDRKNIKIIRGDKIHYLNLIDINILKSEFE